MPAPSDASPTALRLIDLLRPHTPFAEAIVKRQAERAHLTLASIQEHHLAQLGPLIVQASAVFVDPSTRDLLKRALQAR